MNVHEALVKGAFVQLGSPWQGRCQLCSFDITCERGLRESYDRETQRRTSTEKPKPGQVANKRDFADSLHSTS